METIIKKTRELGTSAGVILPRSWLNRQVAVTLFLPTIEKISCDVMEIISSKKLNEDVKGIYLVGSYARGEEDEESDIDILIITGKSKGLIKQDNYEVTVLPEDYFSKSIKDNLNYISYVSEAKTIINKELIDKYKGAKNINKKKILSEIKRVIEINKDAVITYDNSKKKVPDGIIYSLVLRLRELYILKCLLSKKKHSKKEIKEVVGEENYKAYQRVKEEKEEKNSISPKEAMEMIELSEKWLKELRE